MKLRKMKLRKIPFYLLLALLTLGASLIIGFLSFTGMFTLFPILGLAIGAFVLSVAYEGEVYLQNIKGSLNKLFFKRDYLKNHLANDFLLAKFTNGEIDTSPNSDCPQFFRDYEAQLKLLSKFEHKRLDKASRKNKKHIAKTLRDMEKWFAQQLFSSGDAPLNSYEEELHKWLVEHGQKEAQELLLKRQKYFKVVAAGSVLAGFFMGVGTTYLLVDAFATLPFLAIIPFGFLPIIIVPLAIIAGAAYTFLVYNAVTDMINNDSLRQLYFTFRKDLKSGLTPRNVIITVAAVVLLALTVGLTVCTAGTWWTVVKNARPIFSWMGKIPNLIAGSIAVITGIAQLSFNVQQIAESFELIDDATKSKISIWTKISEAFSKGISELRKNENWLQLINIPRLILMLTFVPLRIILFLGHLVGIAVSSDRVPGIPEIVSAILGFTSEFFEDLHYFLGDLFHNHDHDHKTKNLLKARFGGEQGHNHGADIPTRTLKFLFTPLFYAAAGWDWLATRIIPLPRQECGLLSMTEEPTRYSEIKNGLRGKNAVILANGGLFYADRKAKTVKKIESVEEEVTSKLKNRFENEYRLADEEDLNLISALTGRHATTLSWKEALARQTGQARKESVTIEDSDAQPSPAWKIEHTAQQINHYIDKHLKSPGLDPQGLAPQKIEALQELSDEVRFHTKPEEINNLIATEAENGIYNKHRHHFSFFQQTGNTRTQDFLGSDLPKRISAAAAA